MGNVLAAVDSRGRLSLYIVGYAQGSLSLVRQNFALDPDNDMHAVVGLHWLPVHPQESKVGLESQCNSNALSTSHCLCKRCRFWRV